MAQIQIMGEVDKGCFMCACRLERNFFVHSVGEHFEYDGNDEVFTRRYEAEAAARLNPSEQPEDEFQRPLPPVDEVLTELRKQLEERRRAPEESRKRAAVIADQYKRLRPEVFTLEPKHQLSPDFIRIASELRACGSRPTAVNDCIASLCKEGLLRMPRQGLFIFDVLTPTFCGELVEELDHFKASGLPKTAPNTMNRHGAIMRELGFSEGLLDPFVAEYVDPIAAKLLPLQAEGLDSYRAFTVCYDAADGDHDLAMHYDNAEVTLNVNIGGNWAGGEVTFFGPQATRAGGEQDPISLSLACGEGVLHSARELHQAEPVTAGERQNLILWCRSSPVRNEQCPMCCGAPRLVPTNQHAHEGFTVPN
eukprot:CAMPEP_0170593868 /NCGR_PEP_ID=MMETSP0224-20130122/13692_1 /TAXON_ID=285029 /ORGANISM="Togula jolla, Strain CCCM 725" /LENGTH=364 /DNA_ID=CAMNT_0010917879 /DNA_START=41 /DNA_END=1135 /DNA_ORIENTATION=-